MNLWVSWAVLYTQLGTPVHQWSTLVWVKNSIDLGWMLSHVWGLASFRLVQMALAGSLGLSSMLSLINLQAIPLGLLSWQWQDPSLQASCGLKLRTDTLSLCWIWLVKTWGGKRLCLLIGGSCRVTLQGGNTQRAMENCGHFCCLLEYTLEASGGLGCQDSLNQSSWNLSQ